MVLATVAKRFCCCSGPQRTAPTNVGKAAETDLVCAATRQFAVMNQVRDLDLRASQLLQVLHELPQKCETQTSDTSLTAELQPPTRPPLALMQLQYDQSEKSQLTHHEHQKALLFQQLQMGQQPPQQPPQQAVQQAVLQPQQPLRQPMQQPTQQPTQHLAQQPAQPQYESELYQQPQTQTRTQNQFRQQQEEAQQGRNLPPKPASTTVPPTQPAPTTVPPTQQLEYERDTQQCLHEATMARHKQQHEAIVAQLQLQHSTEFAALQQELDAQRALTCDAQKQLAQQAAQHDSKQEELQRWGEEQAKAAREQLNALGQIRLELEDVRQSERVAVASEAAWRAQLNKVNDERRLERAEQQGVRERLHEALAALDHEREAASYRVAELAQVRSALESSRQQLVIRNARCEALDRDSHQLRHELRRLERLVYGKGGVASGLTSRGSGVSHQTNVSLQDAALLCRTADERYGSGQVKVSVNSTTSHATRAAPSMRVGARKPRSGRKVTKTRHIAKQRTGRSCAMHNSGPRSKLASTASSVSETGTATDVGVPTVMSLSQFNLPLGISSEHSMSSFLRAHNADRHHEPATA